MVRASEKSGPGQELRQPPTLPKSHGDRWAVRVGRWSPTNSARRAERTTWRALGVFFQGSLGAGPDGRNTGRQSSLESSRSRRPGERRDVGDRFPEGCMSVSEGKTVSRPKVGDEAPAWRFERRPWG